MGIGKILSRLKIVIYLILILLVGCAHKIETYRDPNMDFGAVRTVAVMPFVNLSRDQLAGDRARDVFINALLATGAVYVLPTGEVARGVVRAEIPNPFTPSPEEAMKLGKTLKSEAIVTGTVKEYGDVRSSTTSANVISMSLQVMETETGKVVWTGSTTKGGITIWDRLLGGGGQPMDIVTVKAVNDLINKLFK
jgi:hypothetical protein